MDRLMDRRGTTSRAWLAGLTMTCLALSLSACGSDDDGPKVAALTPSTSASASSSGSADDGEATGEKSVLAYAQCMRSHGIKAFPDPNADGELDLVAGPGTGIDPDDPAYQAADTACKSLMPAASGPPPGLKDANLKYAKCMREQGIADFPDPQPDGTLQIQAEPGSDLDGNNPLFKAANQACQKYLPDGKGGSLSSHP